MLYEVITRRIAEQHHDRLAATSFETNWARYSLFDTPWEEVLERVQNARSTWIAETGEEYSSQRFWALESMERQMLARALERTGWNVSRAARELGLSRDTLRYRIET